MEPQIMLNLVDDYLDEAVGIITSQVFHYINFARAAKGLEVFTEGCYDGIHEEICAVITRNVNIKPEGRQ